MRLAIITSAILAMCASLGYAAHREFRPSPQAEYERINQRYFDGQLPLASVRYAVQEPGTLASTTRDDAGVYRITIDQSADTSLLRHEACHTVTFDEIEEHGPLFMECMKRFE